ncbi:MULTISPECIES: hypothetical protein [unclassified Leptolyngbya]|uniref:photosystem II protein, Psb35-related n=1 Tax=unclassified Leptolyngbya TaxID=2650499 RepID=UPI001685EF79|nr:MULTISPECIES: hypothetical protein [unclassified Leptolyngbya]MBD1912294.1 hypothetical protein [Leptolyngbya sp. FACHB-8]MBD2153863.1 hypothetical protein [Leptolyngbya sp. FACHB-16]
MVLLIALFGVAWVAAAVIGTQAYFRGEQTKPIHERNWRSNGFEALAQTFTGSEIDYSNRVPAFQVVDAYTSRTLPNR